MTGGRDVGEPRSGEATEPPDEVATRTPEPVDGAVVSPAGTGPYRSTRIGLVVALLFGLLGFTLAAQLGSGEHNPGLKTARETDLVQILDEVESRGERLRIEIEDLEVRRHALTSQTQGTQNALAEARRRATELGILAGTEKAEGPGIVLTVRERTEQLSAEVILDTVEELRGAGAEALQITGGDGRSVRIVASTFFVNSDEGIVIGGQTLTVPYTFTVIGDPATMSAALLIPGGVADTVRSAGGSVRIDDSRETVTVTALHTLRPPRYARPV